MSRDTSRVVTRVEASRLLTLLGKHGWDPAGQLREHLGAEHVPGATDEVEELVEPNRDYAELP